MRKSYFHLRAQCRDAILGELTRHRVALRPKPPRRDGRKRSCLFAGLLVWRKGRASR